VIDLYFWPTGNGKKVVILLEEAGLPYQIKPVNIGRGDQFSSDYLKIAPNNRMPAIVDHDPIGGGGPLSIFESGAIMMYLAEKAGKFWPQEPHKKYEVAQWCYWQTGNQGPKMGEQGNFARAAQNPANGDLHYALKRFGDEVHRLYGVMNLGLFGKRYLAAGVHDCRHDLLPVVGQLADARHRHRRVPEREALARRDGGAAGGAEGHGARPGVPRRPRHDQRGRANQRAQPVPAEWMAAAE
jgi:glutathione S-transferase